ncbi:MAG: DUF302 domain-containing protein [Pseudomonadota bacterium]
MRILALIAALAAGPALADIEKIQANGDVNEVMDRLEAAVTGAGATVFARVDHGGGAEKAGLELGDSQLLMFGNPNLGTPAMQADARAGLYLPLKVLVYADGDGQTWVAYEPPAAMFEGLEIPADAEFVAKMTGALGKFSAAAAGQ